MKTQDILSLEERTNVNEMPVLNIEQTIENIKIQTLCVPLTLYLKAVHALQMCEAKLVEVCKHGQDDELRNFCGLKSIRPEFTPLT